MRATIRPWLYCKCKPILRFVAAACLMAWCSPVFAQSYQKGESEGEFARRSIIKVSLFSPFAGAVNVHYEMQHNLNSSSQFEFFYFTGLFFGQPSEYKGSGFTYDYRYYLRGNYPKGFYVQPYVRFQKYEYVGTQNPTVNGGTPVYENVLSYGTGMVFGYQTIFKRRFSFEVFGGPSYCIAFGDGTRLSSQDVGIPVNGGGLRLGATIGYAF